MDGARLVGLRSNARLIIKLWHLKQTGKLNSVAVCTPGVCRTKTEWNSPDAVMAGMRMCGLAPSQGGFHEVVEDDYRAYALAAEDINNTENIMRLLQAHPAWRAMSFIKSLNKKACAELLSKLIDPRWFVDRCYPDKNGRMESAFGLNPRTQIGVTLRNQTKQLNHKWCRVVLESWKSKQFESEVMQRLELANLQPIENCELLGVAPYDFLWRIWGYHMGLGGNRAPDAVKADLRASQRLLHFIRYTWLAELYAHSGATPEQRAALFRPADFFKHPLEIAAFECHEIETAGLRKAP